MKIRLLFIVLGLLNVNAFSQKVQKSYTIKSFEGEPQKITLKDNGWGKAIDIKCGTNKLAIPDNNGIEAVHVLKDKFLEIIYGERGGSGLTLSSVLIVCVSDGKLITAMTSTYSAWTVGAGYERKYNSILDLTGDDKKGYILSVNIHEKVEGTSPGPNGQYDKRKTVKLALDPVQHIFYSGQKKVDQMFKFFDKRKPKQFKGNFPFIDIDGETNYFINGLWYELSHFNEPPGPYQMKGDYLNDKVTRIN